MRHLCGAVHRRRSSCVRLRVAESKGGLDPLDRLTDRETERCVLLPLIRQRLAKARSSSSASKREESFGCLEVEAERARQFFSRVSELVEERLLRSRRLGNPLSRLRSRCRWRRRGDQLRDAVDWVDPEHLRLRDLDGLVVLVHTRADVGRRPGRHLDLVEHRPQPLVDTAGAGARVSSVDHRLDVQAGQGPSSACSLAMKANSLSCTTFSSFCCMFAMTSTACQESFRLRGIRRRAGSSEGETMRPSVTEEFVRSASLNSASSAMRSSGHAIGTGMPPFVSWPRTGTTPPTSASCRRIDASPGSANAISSCTRLSS